MKQLPISCPSCANKLAVKRLYCENCGTEVEGEYALPALASLSPDDQDFLLKWVNVGGSLKDVARVFGVSYPTVRNRLDAVIDQLGKYESKRKEKK